MAGSQARTRTRRELSAAALTLFADNGYESTTVDQIAAEAGVARRTFFRYFPTKEDAVFPDHDATLAKVSEVLTSADVTEEPIAVVCRGIREVLRMYISDAAVSVARYRLLRQVPALREREIAVVSRYERLFTKFLLAHPSTSDKLATPHAALLAEVSAAAVVATHNHVLRRWLRAQGEGDALAQLDEALDIIRAGFIDRRPGEPIAPTRDVVVAVSQTRLPTDKVIEAVRQALS